MKSAPLILISPSTQRRGVEFFDYSINLSDAYPRAIAMAGGIPWVNSCTPSPTLIAESVRRSDGVMLSGGDDVQPVLYQANLSPRLRKTLSPADPGRDYTELLLIQECFRQRKPLLAICRGQQILNVALGGTLIVDIAIQQPETLNHSRLDLKDRTVHDIAIQPNSLLSKIFRKEKIGVNSSHHQAVGEVAAPFQVTAKSPDGVVEAMELAPHAEPLLPYLLAVQFHPERLVDRYPAFVNLFRSFVRACAKKSL